MIPFFELQAQYLSIRPELDEVVTRVLESGQYVLGESVQAFEDAFAAYCGARYTVAVNSGISALHLAFVAAGVGPGERETKTDATVCYGRRTTGSRP